jgi:hypothetical protein
LETHVGSGDMGQRLFTGESERWTVAMLQCLLLTRSLAGTVACLHCSHAAQPSNLQFPSSSSPLPRSRPSRKTLSSLLVSGLQSERTLHCFGEVCGAQVDAQRVAWLRLQVMAGKCTW